MAEKQDKAGCGMQIFAFLLLAGLILLVGWFGSRQCDKWAAENEAEYLSKPIQQVHIRELLEAYDQNVANADAKYGNARLMVTGTVTQVYPDGTIHLDAGAYKYRYATGVIMGKRALRLVARTKKRPDHQSRMRPGELDLHNRIGRRTLPQARAYHRSKSYDDDTAEHRRKTPGDD